jgi:small multidrug resistance pump
VNAEVPTFYRRWFYSATVYNLVWGLVAILFPVPLFAALGVPPPNYPSLFRCIGMMVLVYAGGYYLLAKDPIRYAPFIWIAIAGKTFGPIGFIYAASIGELPWIFGLNLLTNDLIWWPVFWMFALRYARKL